MHRTRISRLIILLFAAFSFAGHALRAQTPTPIWSFTDKNGDGAIPVAPVILDASGAVYGTTAVGGAGLSGIVFKLTPPSGNGSWTEDILYHFEGGIDGQQPNDIVFGPKGEIYSTTFLGGSANCFQGCGTIFQLTPPSNGGSWTKQLLYEFTGGQDGQAPGNVKIEPNHALYGTTPSTVWKFAKVSGVLTKTIIHAFPADKGDGQAANADIVFDSKGNLYGTSYYGGNSNYGTVFELSPPSVVGGAWTETILHSFSGSSTDGGYPIGGLVIGRNGVIYGTASYSGVANPGRRLS